MTVNTLVRLSLKTSQDCSFKVGGLPLKSCPEERRIRVLFTLRSGPSGGSQTPETTKTGKRIAHVGWSNWVVVVRLRGVSMKTRGFGRPTLPHRRCRYLPIPKVVQETLLEYVVVLEVPVSLEDTVRDKDVDFQND